MKKFIFLVMLSSFCSSCTTLGSMETSSPRGGNSQVYGISYKKAFDLVLYTCEVMDFKVESKNYEQKYIVAKNGLSAWSWGERIGVYLKEINPNQTEVRVVSKPKIKTNVLAPHWANEFHQVMQKRLHQLHEVDSTD